MYPSCYWYYYRYHDYNDNFHRSDDYESDNH